MKKVYRIIINIIIFLVVWVCIYLLSMLFFGTLNLGIFFKLCVVYVSFLVSKRFTKSLIKKYIPKLNEIEFEE